MKKFNFVLAFAASAAMASAATHSLDRIQNGWRSLDASGATVAKLKSVPAWMPSATRSVDDPQTAFDATSASFYYYGDRIGNGRGVYQLFLADMAYEKGMPSETGHMARIEFLGEMTDEAAPTLCCGTFDVVADITEENMGSNIVVGPDSDILDVFPHPEDPGAGLVAYGFVPVDGKLTIEETDGCYSVSFSGNGALYDSYTEEILLEQPYSCSFSGEIPYEDLNAYTPFEGDVELPEIFASGRYSDGDYSIAFYTDGLLDEEGWIVGAGYLLNAEIFVEPVAPMNIDNLADTFTPNDLMEFGPTPGTFAQGLWYDMYGSYFAILTSLCEYNEYGVVSKVALAEDGTIKGTRIDENTFRLDFDLVSAEGHKITAVYEGDLEAAISDFSDPSAVKAFGNSGRVSVSDGCIIAPAGARVFNMSGVATGTDNLPAGIYLVCVGGRIQKVVVK